MPHTALIKKEVVEEIFNNNSSRERLLKNAEDFLDNRFNGKECDMDSIKAFSPRNKTYKTKHEFCNAYKLDVSKKNIFVMLHAFNDFPHHYEKDIFIDYYRWFIETLKIATVNSDVNWIFKEHPSAEFYPDDANLEGLLEITDHKNIVFLDRHVSFNSSSLIHIADAIVTCIGTAALEFSCFGIPAVIAGGNQFSGFGICTEPENFEEYEKILSSIQLDNLLIDLTEGKKESAKILFYMLYKFSFGRSHANDGFVPFTTHESHQMPDFEESYLRDVELELKKNKTKEFLEKLDFFVKTKNQEDLICIEDYLR